MYVINDLILLFFWNIIYFSKIDNWALDNLFLATSEISQATVLYRYPDSKKSTLNLILLHSYKNYYKEHVYFIHHYFPY